MDESDTEEPAEVPRDEGDDDPTFDEVDVEFGETLYTEDGDPVGTIRGLSESTIHVTIRDGVEALSIGHERSGHKFGEAELMWRCMNCGEMGEIDDGLPEECPNCGEPREELMYWTED